MNDPSTPPEKPRLRTLAEARLHPQAFFYLDCENEIPVTCSIRHVKCSEDELQNLSDDLGLYGLLTDATHCICYARHDALPSHPEWTQEQLSGEIWVAPLYKPVLGPAIQHLLSGNAHDLYNERFDPTAHFFSNYPNYDLGETSLYLAARNGDGNDIFTRMLRCAPNINARNTNGDTPLHGAARNGNATVVDRLLDLGADINAKGDQGKTPLHEGLLNQNWKYPPPVDAIKVLINRNADVNAVDKYGMTPLNYLMRWCPEQTDVKEMLLARGAVMGRKSAT